MELNISNDHAQFLVDQVAAGVFPNADAAVDAALGLLRKQAAIRERVRRGCEQLERGEYIELDDEGLDAYFEALFDPATGGEDS